MLLEQVDAWLPSKSCSILERTMPIIALETNSIAVIVPRSDN